MHPHSYSRTPDHAADRPDMACKSTGLLPWVRCSCSHNTLSICSKARQLHAARVHVPAHAHASHCALCSACSRRASASSARLCSYVAWLCANCSTQEATKCAIMKKTRLCQAETPPKMGTQPHAQARSAPRLRKLSASRARNHLHGGGHQSF